MSTNKSITTKADHVEMGFMDTRAKVLDIAAFLDRVHKTKQSEDYRVHAIQEAVEILLSNSSTKTKDILLSFSDPSEEPIETAQEKGAVGTWDKNA